jgi:hypothetical protein
VAAYHLKGRVYSIPRNLLANSIFSVILLANHSQPMAIAQNSGNILNIRQPMKSEKIA